MCDIIVKEEMSSKDAERQFLVEWIRLYRELPALWRVKSEEYTNRQKKDVAYQKLVSKYREKYPNTDREAVKKKLNSLRTNFRKELRKIIESKASQSGTPYVSKLWYFKDMEFLTDQNEGNDYSLTQNERVRSPTTLDVTSKKKKRLNTRDEISSTTCREGSTLEEDEYKQLAQVWSTELQKMDRTQQLFAKKAINDILFEGQLGTLHRNSVVINSSNPPINNALLESVQQDSIE